MRISRGIFGALIAALVLVVLPAASAQAAPFSMSIDNAIMDLGAITGTRAIDSQLEPPDQPATLDGDVSGNTVTVPKDGFYFPTKHTEASGIPIVIDLEANEDITGTFDEASGALSLDVSLKATVQVLGSTCVISPIAMTLSTDNSTPYLGEPFTGGIDGEGVLSANWSGLPPVTGGGSCNLITGLIAGPGGIAMSHGVHDFGTCATDPSDSRCAVEPGDAKPTVAPKITSGPSASTEADSASFAFEKGDGETSDVTGFQCSLDNGAFEACDSGAKEYTGLAAGAHTFQVKATNSAGEGPVAESKWTITKKTEPCPPGTTGTPPDCKQSGGTAKLGALKVQPKAKKIKRGKKATVKVKVKNVGNAAATGVKVCVKAPKKLVKVKKCVSLGQVAAGKVKTAKFKVKAKRKKGQAVLKFTASSSNAGKKAGKAKVRIK